MQKILDRLSDLVGYSMERDLTPEEKQEIKTLEGQLSAILSTKNKK